MRSGAVGSTGDWAFKYMNFNNFSRKKAKEQEAKRVKRELRAKKSRGETVNACVQPAVDAEKDAVVRALQSRWWYALPTWPPEHDYGKLLEERGLKLVAERDLGLETKEEGVKDRVRPIVGFPGLYQSRRGRIYDLRDKTACPSYHNLTEQPLPQLEEWLLTALRAQLAELTALPEHDTALAASLSAKIQALLQKAENQAKEANVALYAPVEDKPEDVHMAEEPEDIRSALDDELWR